MINIMDLILDILSIKWNIVKISLPIFIFFFIINLELDPKMGSVWYRINSMGYKNFNYQGILVYFTSPFKNTILWNYKLWRFNPYVSAYIFMLIIKYLDIIYIKCYLIKNYT